MYNYDDCSSDDEDVWLEEIHRLRAYLKKPGDPDDHNNTDTDASTEDVSPIQVLRLISSGLKRDTATSKSNVIILNKILICVLTQVQSRIVKRLEHNKLEQERIQIALKDASSSKVKPVVSLGSFVKCGMPFFKTRDGRHPPLTEQRKLLDSLGCATPEMHFGSVKNWTSSDHKQLKIAVYKYWRNYNLASGEAHLRKIVSGDLTEAALNRVGAQLKADWRVDYKSVIVNKVNWSQISQDLKFRFSDKMCKFEWINNCDPCINRLGWSKSEIDKLMSLSFMGDFHDWPKVVEMLGTNRTTMQCCIKYMREMAKCCPKWTAAEEKLLLEVYDDAEEKYARPGLRVAYYFPNYTTYYVNHHLQVLLKARQGKNSKLIVKKPLESDQLALISLKEVKMYQRNNCRALRLFSYEEDNMLLEAITHYDKDWTEILKYFPGKTVPQLEKRYKFFLKCTKDINTIVQRLSTSDKIITYDVWSVLQLMWEEYEKEEQVEDFRVRKDATSAMDQLFEYLQPGYKHLFGPVFPIPVTADEIKSMSMTFAMTARCLKIKFQPKELINRIPAIDEFLERSVVALGDSLFCCTKPSNYIFPPNLLTLVGLRTILRCRAMMHARRDLPISFYATPFDRNIAMRLTKQQARKLLGQRIFSLFFISYCLTKVTEPSSQLENHKDGKKFPPKQTRSFKTVTKAAKKRRAFKLNAVRWNSDLSNCFRAQVMS